ncbi:hypothetical protein ACOI1C_12655 [Bacillus sp. DJP31]|uniref:hypothetical protein n=1 Tax=Bacillus sp. DJP31 TaxID=3409789 RepID=UPI003BB5FCD2
MEMMINEDFVLHRYMNSELIKGRTKNSKDIEVFLTEIFALTIINLQKQYSSFLLRIIPSKDTVYKPANEIDNHTIVKLKSLIEVLTNKKYGTSKELGVIKFYLDAFFLSITTKGKLEYLYDGSYLLTVDEVAERIGINHQTIHRYGKNGQLEIVETTNHRQIPLHVIEILKDADLMTRIQLLSNAYLERENSLSRRCEKIMIKIKKFEENYNNQPFEKVYKDVIKGNKHWDEVESVSDYFEWEALVEELQEINTELGSK